MGQPDEFSRSPASASTDVEAALQSLRQDLSGLSGQLNGDIQQLQARKQQLWQEVQALEQEYQELKARHGALQADHTQALSQAQQVQQQRWAKRLAQVLANNLYDRLSADVQASGSGSSLSALPASQQSLASLDSALRSTLQSLQQDLNSYQSALSKQVSRMQSMEHQGEALLEALVHRLSQQLQAQMVQTSTPISPGAAPPQIATRINPKVAARAVQTPLPQHQGAAQPTHQASPQLSDSTGGSPGPKGSSGSPLPWQAGIVLMGLSTLALAIHNVAVGSLSYGGQVVGLGAFPSLFPLNLPNALLLLWLKLVLVLPLIALVAPRLYPRLWSDIRQLRTPSSQRTLGRILASGGFLFLSQLLLFQAIALVGPGVAVGLLFMYPLLATPLAWMLFREGVSPLRLVGLTLLALGGLFTAFPSPGLAAAGWGWGIAMAVLASATYACYLMASQLSSRHAHPVPVGLLQLVTMLALATGGLLVGSLLGVTPTAPANLPGLGGGAAILALLALVSYGANHYGVRHLGSATAPVLVALGPLVTAIAAYLAPAPLTQLPGLQWLGVGLVTLAGAALSLERRALEQRRRQQRQLR